uniref:PEST proteolytic signal-containing nuclear protein n=1 Tax=Anopheles culicifacies TaxID=139723 RepID=A0A182LVY0_9DIPT
MSRWDRRNDEGQYNQRQRNEIKHASNRPRLSRSRSRSDSSDTRSHSRSRSRSPGTHNPRHRAPSYKDERYDQRNQHRRHQQEEEERRRRQEALDSRGRAGPNGTRGPGPGGTPGMGGKRTSGSSSDYRASTGASDGSKPKPPVAGIQMKLAAPASKEPPRLMKPVANAFRLADDSDDSEPEEMPAECRMRMRNIGRDTPTSSGPNSFGKTKHGFCDSKKMFEKKIGSSLGNR